MTLKAYHNRSSWSNLRWLLYFGLPFSPFIASNTFLNPLLPSIAVLIYSTTLFTSLASILDGISALVPSYWNDKEGGLPNQMECWLCVRMLMLFSHLACVLSRPFVRFSFPLFDSFIAFGPRRTGGAAIWGFIWYISAIENPEGGRGA